MANIVDDHGLEVIRKAARLSDVGDDASQYVVRVEDVGNKRVKVSANDTSDGYLEDKITAGDGIIISTQNDGGNETLEVKSDLSLNARHTNLLSTGLISGGVISINAGDNTKIDITSGKGIIVDSFTDPDNPTMTNVSWSAITAYAPTLISTTPTSMIVIDSNGDPQNKLSLGINGGNTSDPSVVRDYIPLGFLSHSNLTNIDFVSNTPLVFTTSVASNLMDLAFAIGLINLKGNKYSAYATDLRISKSLGYLFATGTNYNTDKKNPNISQSAIQSPAIFAYAYQDGIGGFAVTAPTYNINPNKYDDGSGTLANVSANKWTVQRIYITESGFSIVHYGQAEYASIDDAVDGILIEDFNEDERLATALKRAYLLVKIGTTDLSNTSVAIFRQASKFGI